MLVLDFELAGKFILSSIPRFKEESLIDPTSGRSFPDRPALLKSRLSTTRLSLFSALAQFLSLGSGVSGPLVHS